MPVAFILALLLQAEPPATREHFRQEVPSHVFLVVDDEGETVRANGSEAAEHEAFPTGSAARLFAVMRGLESGRLHAEQTVPCDSTCWSRGAHGQPALAEALAFGCDSWFLRAGGDTTEGGGDRARTAREWTDFWRGLSNGSLGLRSSTTSTLLAATGMAVASPRGAARSLYAPDRSARAVAGGSDAGAWVAGTLERRGGIRWAFALFVRGGSPRLTAARAASLLDETIRKFERGSLERGGRPPAPLDEEP